MSQKKLLEKEMRTSKERQESIRREMKTISDELKVHRKEIMADIDNKKGKSVKKESRVRRYFMKLVRFIAFLIFTLFQLVAYDKIDKFINATEPHRSGDLLIGALIISYILIYFFRDFFKNLGNFVAASCTWMFKCVFSGLMFAFIIACIVWYVGMTQGKTFELKY